MLLLIIFISFNQIFTVIYSLSNKCCLPKDQEKYMIVTLKDFDDFNELKFQKCDQYDLIVLEMIPNSKRLILDNTLNFSGLYLVSKHLTIEFKNLNGIDIATDPFEKILQSKGVFFPLSLKLDYSNLNFFFKTKLIDKCNQNLFSFGKNLFSKLNILDIGKPNLIYVQNVCPLVFYRANIKCLRVSSTDSFFAKNKLTFINYNSTKSIKSRISELNLALYHIDLDSKLLSKHVFNRTHVIVLNGVIKSIQNDLFKDFNHLKILYIKIQNLNNLFKKRNKWIHYLNYNTKIINPDESDFIKLNSDDQLFWLVFEQTHPNLTKYTFPDQDFCYFYDFPHYKAIMPIFFPNLFESCTYFFLTQYSDKCYAHYLNQTFNEFQYQTYYYNDERNIYQRDFKLEAYLNNKCGNFIKFKSLICASIHAQEKTELSRNKSESYFYLFDWQILIKYNQIIFAIILNPSISLICLILNILIVKICSNKELDNIYVYLKLNSCFVILYLLASFFKLLFVCIKDTFWNDAHLELSFCLDEFRENSARYFNIVFVRTLGSCFKTCSNMSYLLFLISRYKLITNSKSIWINRIDKISICKKCITICLISLFINSYSYFQFSKFLDQNLSDMSIRKYSGFFDKTEYAEFFSKFNEVNDYTQDLSSSYLLWLNILNLIKIIFSDIFFLIIGTIFDVLLLIFIKNQNKTQISREVRKQKSAEKRLIVMIILNGINFLIFRLPSLIVSFYGIIYRYDHEKKKHLPNFISYYVCRNMKFCIIITDIFHFFYLLSFVFHFAILYKLDKNFKKSLKNLFKK